jgi:signal transduction histidine kinase
VFLLACAAAGFVLWALSGIMARKVARPLWDLVLVTREIGEGKLSSRARLGRHHVGEVGVLASSINEMASRIERQLSDQKELLASVSHEIRTPLTRLRVLTEFLRDSGASEKLVHGAEIEIAEIDDLTGKLLATSRLEFEAWELLELDAAELCRSTLERLGHSNELLKLHTTDTELVADATLLGRALLNLLMNAAAHGGGPKRLCLERSGDSLRFTVEDDGPGFDPADLGRVFDSFYRGKGSGGSLGLGLSLVRRIARAHGGDAFAENLPTGGARVGFTVRVRPTAAV